MEQGAELERQVEYLVEHVGLERWEAEKVMEDDDLWVVMPEQRFAFSSAEEAVRQWEAAREFAHAISEGFGQELSITNDATRQLVWDLRDRADEALSRARQRANH